MKHVPKCARMQITILRHNRNICFYGEFSFRLNTVMAEQ